MAKYQKPEPLGLRNKDACRLTNLKPNHLSTVASRGLFGRPSDGSCHTLEFEEWVQSIGRLDFRVPDHLRGRAFQDDDDGDWGDGVSGTRSGSHQLRNKREVLAARLEMAVLQQRVELDRLRDLYRTHFSAEGLHELRRILVELIQEQKPALIDSLVSAVRGQTDDHEVFYAMRSVVKGWVPGLQSAFDERGAIVVSRGTVEFRPFEVEFDANTAVAELEDHLLTLRTIRERLRAQVIRFRMDVRDEKWLPHAELKRVGDAVVRFREGMLGIGNVLAPQLTGLNDARAIARRIEQSIDALTGQLQERLLWVLTDGAPDRISEHV